ncbi:AraC family transcriptional regulator [Sediminibacterium roseum]|uniref:AraC family transcriptional regulator n=1 Tax=Sediminibacterium roseum TaxID=1978412 RepID=A0ABW9ZTM1_9BACT|nr:helix-turn-helix domain-containing protein [Sediminibacterium roseum]NCI49408.1 AraC family transcriptional regulator [Sediminibacterium roseum]
MSFGDKALFFFSCLGAFNGIILSLYFFFFTSRKYLSNYLLGALLFVLSLRIGKSVAYFFDKGLPKTYLQVGLTACFFIGPFLYFFVRAETQQVREMKRSWIGQLITWLLLVVVTGLLFPYEYHPRLWGKTIVPLIYLQWGFYIALSVFALIPILKKLAVREPIKTYEKWVLAICSAIFILFFCYVWAYLNITKGSYINAALCFSLILYGVIFLLLYRKKTNDLFSLSPQKYADKKLDPEDAERIIVRLRKVMEEKQLYRNPNLKISDVAKEIHVPAHHLSRVLNDTADKNFTLFVNEYRINEACNMLSQPTNLTIEAVGEEVGFNSKSTFYATFKKIKGITPSGFQEEAGS